MVNVMSEQELKKIYERFVKFHKNNFIFDAKNNSTSLKKLKLSDKTIGQFHDNYYKVTFISFLENLKYILYSDNVYDFVSKDSSEDWKLWPYLSFLEKENLIKVSKDGKVGVLNEEILNLIPAPRTEKEIKEVLEKKLKVKVQPGESVVKLFGRFGDFEVKGQWDQMPISQSSAIFLVHKILERIPLNRKFLFVGDDDFVSIIMGIVCPGFEGLVIDADEKLLETIDFLARKFDLKIKTKKADIRKKVKLGGFVGFLVNPVYTTDGVKEFMKFGISQLGKDGGLVFLEVGDESIGNRFLSLQEFFAKSGLMTSELIREKIFYPYIDLYKEDQVVFERLASLMDKEVIKNSPKLAASLYIFKYFPAKIKEVKFKKPFYAYL
jgi:predicted methyltransferase